MARKRTQTYKSASLTNDGLPKTKTVWGLTKEEIEFYAIFFKVVAIIAFATSFIVITFYLIQLIINASNTVDLVPVAIFFFSSITSSVGIYGITYERIKFLASFAILDFLCIIVFFLSAIIWTQFTLGFI